VCICGVEAGGATWRYVGGEVLPRRVADKLRSYAYLIAHNARYEAGWLQRCGIDTRKLVFWCTYNAEWLLRAGLPSEKGALSLEGVCARRSVGVKMTWPKILLKQEIPCDTWSTDDVTEYCLQDALLCKRLFEEQRIELLRASIKSKAFTALRAFTASNRKEKALDLAFDSYLKYILCKSSTKCANDFKGTLVALQYQRSMLAPVLADIETKGLQLDRELTTEVYDKAVAKREALSAELYTLTKGINLKSSPQLAKYLFDDLGFTSSALTPKGARSTSIDALRSLVATTPDQKRFKELYFEYNSVSELLSKYLVLFKAVCDENNGVLFGEFNQGTTATHRLSSTGVAFKGNSFKAAKKCQLQNIPRELKKLFVARNKGWYIGEPDGSQLEFRVASGLAKDPIAVQEIKDLVDVHAATAQVLQCSRQEAKAHTFAPLFGGNGKTKAERKYSEFFKNKYKVIHKMQRGWCLEVVESDDKRLHTVYGMVYNFPGTTLQADGYISGSTNIFNFPIQGLSTGEIIPIALASLWHNLPDGVEIVNTVHDSIVCEVRPGCEQVWLDACINAMTSSVYEFLERVYGYKLEVPLGIGSKLGQRWGDGSYYPSGELTFQLEDETLYEITKNRDTGRKEKIPRAFS
jgi:DNA polymerase I-like protein with 3'-5' exonuclease and polymerase domains